MSADRAHISGISRIGNLRLNKVDDRKYIDFTAGIAVVALGHADPTLAKLMYDQASQLVHCSNLYHSPWPGELAKLIIEKTKSYSPQSPFQKVFIANSGTESNEAALKFARKVGKERGGENKTDIVCFERAFHGRTFGALSVTPQPKYQKPFAPMVPGVKVGVLNDVAALDTLVDDKTCGVIVEPIQGEGGVRVATAPWLSLLRDLAQDAGALLVADEIQSGFGRTGRMFVCDHYGITPDVLCLGKGIASGLPLAVTVANDEIMGSLAVGEHTSTFGGNPIVCAAAEATIRVLLEEHLVENSAKVGEYFRERLVEMQEQLRIVREVRGMGLMLGVELRFDVHSILQSALQQGVMLLDAGRNVVRFLPPLSIQESHVDLVMSCLRKILAEEELAKLPS